MLVPKWSVNGCSGCEETATAVARFARLAGGESRVEKTVRAQGSVVAEDQVR